MGVYPCVWGPHQWNMLHTIAMAYPDNPDDNRKKSTLGYLHGMCDNLPCPGCSHHCNEYLNAHPPKIESKQKFFEYTVDFHNEVNRRLQKEEWTYSRAKEVYTTKVSDYAALMSLSRADQIRKEDCITINKLKSTLNRLHLYYPIAIVGVVVLMIVLLVIGIAVWKRKTGTNHTLN